MIRFAHDLEDMVRIDVDGKTYSDTKANFELDFGQSLPGAGGRIYEPGVRHSISDGKSVIAGGERDWPLGNQAIAAIDELLQAKQAREAG